jgi:archaetidylinositol phosphate synthase
VFGGILDSTLDRIEEAIVISSIMLAGLCNLGVGLAALVSSFSVSYIRSRAEVEGIETVNIGIAERAERVLVLASASLFQAVDTGIVVLAIISTITVVQRLIHISQARGTPRLGRQTRTL